MYNEHVSGIPRPNGSTSVTSNMSNMGIRFVIRLYFRTRVAEIDRHVSIRCLQSQHKINNVHISKSTVNSSTV